MKKFIIHSLIFFFVTISASLADFQLPKGFISILDVNGTMILTDASTDKTADITKYQSIATQLKMNNGQTAEMYLRDLYGKYPAYDHYPHLATYLDQWRQQGIISKQEYDRFPGLLKAADDAIASTKKYDGVFPSTINYIKAVVAEDPDARIILHSFGPDMQHVIKIIQREVPTLIIHEELLSFNEEGHLIVGDQVITDPSQFKDYVKPGLQAWQANHKGWKKGTGGKVVWKDISVLLDDNAHLCSRPIHQGKICPEAYDDMNGKEIQRVFTYHALVDPNYFIDIVSNLHPKKSPS